MGGEEVRRLLNEGFQAAKANDRPRARDCLMQVLDADPGSEPAWLWLSGVLDNPSDQVMALERVLAINPRHPQAQAGVTGLRRQLGLGQPAPDAPAEVSSAAPTEVVAPPASPPAGTPTPEPLAGFDTLPLEDDPFQCAYCGRLTHPEDERCRHCHRSLLVPGPWRGGGYLYIGLIVCGLQLQSALIQALATYLVSFPQAARILPLASMWSGNLLLPALVRAVAWAVVVLLLLSDYEGGYELTTLVALTDLVWAGVGNRLGYLAAFQAAANTGLGVIIFLIGLMAVISQAQSKQRLRVVPDRGLEGALMFHRRALVYARRGQWALAALHWRKAISRAPGEPRYYKSLGHANIRLGRYAEAVRAFKSGAEVAPGDPDFQRLVETVRVHARTS